MEGDIILQFLMSLHPYARIVIYAISILATLFPLIVALTPWKGDDEALEQIKKMPIVGSLLVALLKFSPISPKK